MNRKVKSILFTNGIRDFSDITILGVKNNFLEILKNDELLKFNISGRDEEEIRLEQEFDEIVDSEDNDFWDDSTITDDDDLNLDLDNDIDLDELIVEENEIVVEKKIEFEDEIIEETEKSEKSEKPKGRPKKNKNDNLIDIL